VQYLAKAPGWAQRGPFDAWFTLANVSPFVLELTQVYAEPLIPGIAGSVAAFMYNARQEFDPIPWLLFGRAFNPSATTISSDTWKAAQAGGFFELIQTTGVAAPKTFTPAISDVHGFANYLMAPDVATKLAMHLNGEGFSDDQLAKINLPAAWAALPALRCTNDPQAYTKLGADVAQFIDGGKVNAQANAVLGSKWFQRLMDAVELIGKATGRC
jgi:hypothetical protein